MPALDLGQPPQTHLGEHVGKLGRIYAPDPRDWPARHLFAAAAPAAQPVKRRSQRVWLPTRSPYDQGSTSQCVLYSITHRLMGHPMPRRHLTWNIGALYKEAQDEDEWPGAEPTYYGTSVRAGLEVARKHQLVHSYWRLNTLDEVLDYLLNDNYAVGGSVVIGTNWSDGMWQVDGKGYLHYNSSAVRGGHAWQLYGANLKRNACYGQNSWGDDASSGMRRGGRFTLSIKGNDGLEALLRDQGDAYALIEVAEVKKVAVAERAKLLLAKELVEQVVQSDTPAPPA